MKKILIVEDELNVLKIYEDALRAAGYEVQGVRSGMQGLVSMRKVKPDLLILDIMLPGGMNGFDVYEKMNKEPELKKIPVLVLTNLSSEKNTAMKMGAVGYMVKANTKMEEVVEKVKGVLGG